MPSIEDITALLVAVSGVLAAAAVLVRAFHDVHDRIDQNSADIAEIGSYLKSSSPKVLPPDNSE